MARTKALPDDVAAKRAREMLTLRLALKMPRTEFGHMVGIGSGVLAEKEAGKYCFHDREVVQIKAAVKKHLAEATELFLQTFDLTTGS